MGFVTNIWKAILLIVNTIFLLLGCGITGLGIWATVEAANVIEGDVEVTLFISFLVGGIFLILGPIITIIAFTGFWGAVAQKKWMLKLYSGFLIVIIILQTALGIYFIYEAHDDKQMFLSQSPGLVNEHTEEVYRIQSSLECCGFYEPSEMQNANGVYPLSCCKKSDTFGTLRLFNDSGVDTRICQPYQTGCWPVYVSYLKAGGIIYGGFVGFEIGCIVAAVFVVRSITKRNLSYRRVA